LAARKPCIHPVDSHDEAQGQRALLLLLLLLLHLTHLGNAIVNY